MNLIDLFNNWAKILTVKSLLLTILMLLSVTFVSVFEANCIDLDNEVSHISDNQHENSENTVEDQGHCSHICMQCHFIAVKTQDYSYSALTSFHKIQFFIASAHTRYIKQSLYRPPIA